MSERKRKGNLMLYPNETWQIEVSKPQGEITSLNLVIKQLRKHKCECCIVEMDRGYVAFRKMEEGEEELLTDKRIPYKGRIVAEYKGKMKL